MSAAACGSDSRQGCDEAYAHLTTIAKRRVQPAVSARFVEACLAVGDTGRVECLKAAKTPGEALACKPQKKRPG